MHVFPLFWPCKMSLWKIIYILDPAKRAECKIRYGVVFFSKPFKLVGTRVMNIQLQCVQEKRRRFEDLKRLEKKGWNKHYLQGVYTFGT